MALLSRHGTVMGVAASLLGTALAASPAAAQSEPWGTYYDRLLERPDVEVTTQTRDDETEVREFRLPGDVVITQERQGEEVSTVAWDASGFGAVLCVWEILMHVRVMHDACDNAQKNPAVGASLEIAIDRINAFIAENSLEPTSIAEVDEAMEARLDRIYAENLEIPRGATLTCPEGDLDYPGFPR